MGKKKRSRNNNKKKNKRGNNNNQNNAASSSSPPMGNNTNNEKCQSNPYIEPGKWAMVINLKGRKGMNGEYVKIQKVLTDGRVAVEYTTLPGTTLERKEQFSIKEENLQVLWAKASDKDQGEECPICMDTIMFENNSKISTLGILSCCGKCLCLKCFVQIQERNHNRCPFCNSDFATCDKDIISNWHARAERGDLEALFELGHCYLYGIMGLSQDQSTARVYFKKAALKGCKRSANHLGCMHMNGEGGPIDYAEGTRWFHIASDLGNTGATTNLGLAYWEGHGVPRDTEKAAAFLQKSIDAGSEKAIEIAKSLFLDAVE